jgi:hypothetical protein
MAVKSLKRSSVKSTQKANAMNAGYSFQDYELIESVFLSASASSVTFGNLDQYANEYKHLQIRTVVKTDNASTGDSIRLRINNDSGANYFRHGLFANGTAVGSFAVLNETSLQFGNIAGATTSGLFGASIIDIVDAFSLSKNKTIRSLAGYSSFEIFLRTGARISLEPTSSITLSPVVGTNFVNGSRFSLYGIR